MYDLHKQWTNEGTYSLPTEVLSEFAKRLKPFAVPPIENRMDFANHSTMIIWYVILQKQWKAKNETISSSCSTLADGGFNAPWLVLSAYAAG